MNRYQDFEFEDFLYDEFFIEWVLNPKQEHQLFWENWLRENPGKSETLNRAVLTIRSLYLKPLKNTLTDEEVSSIADFFERETAEKVNIKRNHFLYSYRKWVGAAAAIFFCIALGLIYTRFDSPSPSKASQLAETNRVEVFNTGRESKLIVLSDGSLVVLKPKSRLTYSKLFKGATREVFLSGEGFFDVHKNPEQPFLVHSGNVVTKVLGTSFTVSAFPGKNRFKVVVNTGKVHVYTLKGVKSDKISSSVILLPDQQAVFSANGLTLKKDSIGAPVMLSPRIAQKIFAFTNTPVPDIIAKLEEAYDVNIEYDKSKYSSLTVTASLSRLPLKDKIGAICKAIGATYEFTSDGIKIN